MITLVENHRGELTRNDEIRKELGAIASGPRGLTPQTVLEVAKNPLSLLHEYFTWDDSEAARRYREAQAYELIRRVKVTIESAQHAQITVRAFWPVKQVESDGTIDPKKNATYLPLAEALSSPEAVTQIIESAKGELRAFSHKYAQLEAVTEMAGVFQAIRTVILPKFGSQEDSNN
jgi:hypothetical protein